MYWINGGGSPKIERANMDNGRERVTLVSADIQKPVGLAVDLVGMHSGYVAKKWNLRIDVHVYMHVYRYMYKFEIVALVTNRHNVL